jgi:hypothetical protein
LLLVVAAGGGMTVDTDGDGLVDAAELVGDTDRTAADTDGDGLDDGVEREAGTDPTAVDTDGDGLDDATERRLGTDPTAADTDGDGLPDRREVNGRVRTDPTAGDTDGDGLSDGGELVLGTDPTAPDTDGDALPDGRELALGTGPGRRDTDGDGFADGLEVRAGSRLPGADPRRFDVYLEVDVAPGCSAADQIARTTAAFADAPVENPDGTTGITLHVERGAHPVEGPVFLSPHEGPHNDLADLRRTQFDHEGEGYHYLVVATETTTGYFGGHRNGTMLATCGSGDTFMHELGHGLGLDGGVHAPIDNASVAFGSYPSVMNYNRRGDVYRFSDGTHGPHDFDDWGYVAMQGRTPDHQALRRALGLDGREVDRDGGASDDGGCRGVSPT